MHKFEHFKNKQDRDSKYLVGFIFIIIGALLLGRNFHIVPYWVSRVFISWQMLLIAIGFVSIFVKKKLLSGLVLIAVGGIFLANKIFYFSAFQWQIIWPAAFIFIGVLMVSNVIGDKHKQSDFNRYRGFDVAETENDDSYNINNMQDNSE